MKKNYQQPAMWIVRIQHTGVICTSQTSTATTVDGNVFNDEIKGGSGPSRGRSVNVWGEEEGEEDGMY